MYVNTLVMCPFLCAVLCDVNKCLSLSLSLCRSRLRYSGSVLPLRKVQITSDFVHLQHQIFYATVLLQTKQLNTFRLNNPARTVKNSSDGSINLQELYLTVFSGNNLHVP